MNKKGAELLIPFIGFALCMAFFITIFFLFFPEQQRNDCFFPAEIDCKSYEVRNSTTDSLVLVLQNRFSEQVNITFAEVLDSKCNLLTESKSWDINEEVTLSFNCTSLKARNQFVSINVVTKTGSYSTKSTGKLFVG
ncbi:hypothetical protein C4573_01890 [Candidatus Woesearchaeota archaeon]|nr:MAG: hypothetical protein C4573_01890 [Candidatus Woesearchaeota archaeon]